MALCSKALTKFIIPWWLGCGVAQLRDGDAGAGSCEAHFLVLKKKKIFAPRDFIFPGGQSF